MLGVMLQKLWHKKWMVVCLLLGIVLLVATVVSFPMYRKAAYDRMLADEFTEYLETEGDWPARNQFRVISKRDAGGRTIARMEEFMSNLAEELGVKEKENIRCYLLARAAAEFPYERTGIEETEVRLAFLSGMQEHIKIAAGENLSESGMTEDGYVEALVSETALVSLNVMVGDTFCLDAVKDAAGNPIKVRITGVFQKTDASDFYWQVTKHELQNACLIKEEIFNENFCGEQAAQYTITCNYYHLFEYENLSDAQVVPLLQKTRYLEEESDYRSTMSVPPYEQILKDYQGKKVRIDGSLVILEIPVLILLAAFLFMISGQLYEMERNEISVLKSRGASGKQIFLLYLYQSIFLTGVGAILGIPLGGAFTKLLGAADHFLQFQFEHSLTVAYTEEVFWYAAAAGAVCILIMTIPAIWHSRVTIVKLKQQRSVHRKKLWERCFLDVIFLAVGCYGYYNYSRQMTMIEESALKGETMDPLLYVSSSLFILGAGMLFIRLLPWLVQGIYQIGKRWWKPAEYAAFLEIIKNGSRQHFIMLFLILTVSLGMFHATVARTILQNAEENQEYLDGADVMLQEVWKDNRAFLGINPDVTFTYYEPDYGKYAGFPGAASYTRVLMERKASVKKESKVLMTATVMGIHTKEFGENTHLSDALLAQPYYEYLNELAVEPEGVLLSSNCKNVLECNVGDTIFYSNKDGSEARGKVLGFVDYWPGYEPADISVNEEGEVVKQENLLIIANLYTLWEFWGVTPYEVWMTLKPGTDTEAVYDWIKENDVPVKKITIKAKDMEAVSKDPLLQGTNGVLTMSFIVMLVLCTAGYLIYWIMSIRAREMVFGVLRACGMHKGEIFKMLFMEQFFSGVCAVFAGIGIGKMTSAMFVPMLQRTYAAANQILPMRIISDAGDQMRLYGGILSAMLICLVVLTVLVFRLNITKALKLGEE